MDNKFNKLILDSEALNAWLYCLQCFFKKIGLKDGSKYNLTVMAFRTYKMNTVFIDLMWVRIAVAMALMMKPFNKR